MTTNTYQSLCDDVGAKITKNCCTCDFDCGGWMISDFRNCEPCKRHYTESVYPPQSAEQRERLLILIARAEKNYSSTFMVQAFGENLHLTADEQLGDGYSFPAEYEVKGENYPEALYALTHKLVQEGVLGKEEVKDCLIGK